jgi:hypothetical protein
MQRLRLYDVRLSDLPESVGLCTGDIPGIANYVNSAQRRLLMCKEAGEEGWWGTWAEVAFNGISQTSPYITVPREVARIQSLNVCQRPVPVQNQFYEYLQFGNGRLPKQRCRCNGPEQAYSRNVVPTFFDLPGPSYISAFPTDSADAAQRTLIQGKDTTGSIIYSEDVLAQVQGVFLPLIQPFQATPLVYGQLTGIQKDVTQGQVQYFAIDAVTGAQTYLLTMEPSETTASYRRYYFADLPITCCQTPAGVPSVLTVTAIVKLDLIPVITDTDYCLIQSLEALKEECMAYRYSRIDSTDAKQWEALHHRNAIGFLNGELNHFLGKDSPAVNFAPFGTARLSRQRIGSMI